MPAVIDPQDFHWAMHAVVNALPRVRYDALAPLPQVPEAAPAQAWADDTEPGAPARRRRRRRHARVVPVFDGL